MREKICHPIYRYAKANNKYMKDYDLCYVNNLYGWAMSQNAQVNNFQWIKDTSQKYAKNHLFVLDKFFQQKPKTKQKKK